MYHTFNVAGRNFGDEGLFFLAESLAFNQVTTILHLSLLSYFLVYFISYRCAASFKIVIEGYVVMLPTLAYT